MAKLWDPRWSTQLGWSAGRKMCTHVLQSSLQLSTCLLTIARYVPWNLPQGLHDSAFVNHISNSCCIQSTYIAHLSHICLHWSEGVALTGHVVPGAWRMGLGFPGKSLPSSPSSSPAICQTKILTVILVRFCVQQHIHFWGHLFILKVVCPTFCLVDSYPLSRAFHTKNDFSHLPMTTHMLGISLFRRSFSLRSDLWIRPHPSSRTCQEPIFQIHAHLIGGGLDESARSSIL